MRPMAEKPTMDRETAHHTENNLQATVEDGRPKGKLKIFLGYAPGTGKTLAMLEDACRRLKAGIDVVAGFVDVHEDQLSLSLLAKFEMLPHHVVNSAGISYQGMNLDQLLARRPELVLVDNLARSNPPGLRHEARYLEVEELLAAGINVYSTLNVYQVESQVDAVNSLTGVAVRETIPDRLLDQADQLEIVDMAPQELIARYSAGLVDLPPRDRGQMEKFFQPANLFALRELTLRYVARRSNTFLRSYLENRGLAAPETSSNRLLVCISGRERTAQLIRAGRRMADEMNSEWTVLHVEIPDQNEVEQTRMPVAQNMRLADILGAKTEILPGRSVVETIHEYALKNHIHRIMVGRSPAPRWYRFLGSSVAEQILRNDPTISVYVVSSDQAPSPFQIPGFLRWLSPAQLLGGIALAAAPTLIGLALSPTVISRSANLIMLYMLSIVLASVTLGLVPALLTAVLSVLAFDYFFIPPLYRLFDFAPEYSLTFFGLLAVSIGVSTLVARERALAQSARRRADQVTQLYEFSRDLAIAVDMAEILDAILKHVRSAFDREAVILLHEKGELVLSASSAGNALDRSELTAAEWAFQQGRPAGNNTGTFSYASFRYFPLETSRGIIGVLGICLAGEQPDLYPDQIRQMGVYVTKAASSIERALFAEEASQTKILRATEKLQSALLNSISHDLRTPLASITGVLDSLRMDEGFLDAESRSELVETAYGEAGRLNRLVGNLLDMSRLESGALRISLQPCDIQDVIGAALNAVTVRLEGHPVHVDIPADLPMYAMDYVLINQVLINLLDNAAKYSPEGGPIDIQASVSGGSLQVAVQDRGPGIPEEDLEHIFEKFFRVKRFENVVGTGLGLSICKGMIEVHGGKIWAENRPGGGVRLVFTIPEKPERASAQSPEAESVHEEIHA